MRLTIVCIGVALAALLAPAAHAADDSGAGAPPGICSTCELQMGIGGTFHYWGTTHSLVIPIVFLFDEDRWWGRWEVGAFRFTGPQRHYDDAFVYHVTFAEPLWGFAVTRRLELLKHRHWELVAGLGGSYKTREDRLSSSLFNFAYEAGVRLTPVEGTSIELMGRHWSNSGLKLPNHGEDFATITFSIYPSLFAHWLGHSQ
jgi:hypothetical protein